MNLKRDAYDQLRANSFINPKVKITEQGQPCRQCGTPVEIETHNSPPKKRKGDYYFEWWLKCPGCHTLYMIESAKRYFPGCEPH